MSQSPLRIIDRGGHLISLDHRRLWVFKHADVTLVPVRRASDQEMNDESFKFTSAQTGGQELGAGYVGVKGMEKSMMEGANALKVQRPWEKGEDGVKELEGGVKYW